MAIKVYEYNQCSTCRNALKFLDQKGIAYEAHSIVETPPSVAELKRMLDFLKAEGKELKNLFNTSGIQYRELKVAQKFNEGLTEAQALKMLSQNGKLIKRPFALSNKMGVVGFKEAEWKNLK